MASTSSMPVAAASAAAHDDGDNNNKKSKNSAVVVRRSSRSSSALGRVRALSRLLSARFRHLFFPHGLGTSVPSGEPMMHGSRSKKGGNKNDNKENARRQTRASKDRAAPPPLAGRVLERIHTSPDVYYARGFLTEAECDHLAGLGVSSAPGGLRRTSTTDDGVNTNKDDAHRTSTTGALRKGQDRVVRNVESRAADVLGLPVSGVEPLQVVCYEQGQFFDVHHDIGTWDPKTNTVDAVSPLRVATVFAYLNDVPASGGGATRFPRLRAANGRGALEIHPKRGDAVVWCNITGQAEPDLDVLHAGEPLRKGVRKVGLNVWLTLDDLSMLASGGGGGRKRKGAPLSEEQVRARGSLLCKQNAAT